MLTSDPELDALAEPPVEPVAVAPGQALRTVCGAPLEPEERVIFFSQPRHTRSKLVYVLVGVLLSPLLVGIALIVYGLLYERWHLRFVAVTNRRVVVQRGNKQPRWLRLGDVTDVRVKRGRSPAGAGAQAQAPRDDGAKTEPNTWRGVAGIVVHGTKGALTVDASVPPELLGPTLAHALGTSGYVDSVPAVVHPQ